MLYKNVACKADTVFSKGPTDVSVRRFLDMVWQYQIPTIIMLTHPVEDGKVTVYLSVKFE